MNILSKMMTALRGGATEAGEAIVDSQALRILDQAIQAMILEWIWVVATWAAEILRWWIP